MNVSRQDGAPSLCSQWREVLGLGEKLLDQAQQTLDTTPPTRISLSAQKELIVETAGRLVQGQAVLWLAEDILRRFTGRPQPGSEPLYPPEPPSTLMNQALHMQTLCCGEDGQSVQAYKDLDVQIPPSNSVAIPLLAAARAGREAGVMGVLQVERPGGPPFETQEFELLDGLAVQAALALRAGLQMVNEHWRLEQLSLVRQVSVQIVDVRDLDELARRVTSLIQQTFKYYYVAIFTLEPDQESLHFRASAALARPEDGEVYSPSLTVNLGQGIIGYVAQTGQEVLARDVRQETLYRHLDVLPETLSEVSLPLKIEDRLLGVLDVQSDQLDYFDETDIMVLRALAGHIASAVEGARLYSGLHRRAAQLSAIYEVSSAITSILDQEKLLNEVVTLIQNRFGYHFVHLFTVHPGRRKVFYEAGAGSLSARLIDKGLDFDLDNPEGIIPWVARNGETVLANDVSQEPRYRPSALSSDETLAELTIPLIFGGEVLGVLDLQSDQLNAFSKDDRVIFEALADHVAIAMRNAHLYRSEVWRRQVADSLREVAGLLTAEVGLDQVLAAILEELERTLPLDLAGIWLLDEDTNSNEGEDAREPVLRLAAVRGASVDRLDLEIGLTPAEVLELNPSNPSDLVPEDAADWLLEALKSPIPVIRSPGGLYEPLGGALDYPVDYSALAAPLRVGERNLGLLTLAHRSRGRYGSEASAMTAAFASYAAVAIENTRLYEEAHEQAWVSTVLLQVAEATQSITSLNELLSTVIQITPMLVGVKACLLYIVDDETFVPAAASGLTPEQQAEFERWRFAAGDVPALDEMLIQHRPVVLSGETEDLRLTSILQAGEGTDGSADTGLLVLVPLVAHGDVFGGFLVDYSAPPGNTNLETFFDEKLAIIQGIAHQTALAVENIRLIKSQKEEAYISVALLQVAQAVVSSNDLDDSLGTIVRITPILVGVKRAVIFLWDAVHKVFQLSQAYGLPRDVQAGPWAEGDFPLLDAVRRWDTLLPFSFNSDNDGRDENYEDNPEAILEAWSLLMPPEMDEVDEYLEKEARLLLAFPLSVKSEVLGVMLVEEPDVAPGDSFGGEGSNRRLRGKRLEIITGISQQAALAIQNDLLQLEMVKRERLEREMQLAREIQRTFLPQTIPDLPGWDLKVLWRTAYQVGGDFYDFFDLPNHRMGLVIADVADKGMPAALYMTLMRTLVRATVQRVSSPGRVLEHVNDILVPDAPKGMFVTLAYAVLNLETGEVEYANAGHNPPILLRHRTCELKRLTRTGMALGVEEGNRILERKITLEPGDYLILYTDGITESFSPDGDMFGDERLHNTIESTAVCAAAGGNLALASAQEMLDAIDQTVTAFVGEAALSDDLTLVVLKRKSI